MRGLPIADAWPNLLELALLGGILVAVGRRIVRGRRERQMPDREADVLDPDDAAREARAAGRSLAARHGAYVSSAAELDDDEEFRDAVDALRHHGLDTAQLTVLARDADLWTSRIALAVLAERDDLPAEWQAFVLRRLEDAPYDQAGLLLRTLARVPGPVLGAVLSHVDDVLDLDLAELVAARAGGRARRRRTAAQVRPPAPGFVRRGGRHLARDERRRRLPQAVRPHLGTPVRHAAGLPERAPRGPRRAALRSPRCRAGAVAGARRGARRRKDDARPGRRRPAAGWLARLRGDGRVGQRRRGVRRVEGRVEEVIQNLRR